MSIPLSEFENYIDEVILERGLSYFEKGYIEECDEVSIGEYEAIVKGTENYVVNLKINNEEITDYRCDCPYDMGPVCKHIAAVIFYLNADKLEIPKKKKPQKRKTKKVKSLKQQVDDLLKKIDEDELKNFIREKSAQNKTFRDIFLAEFAAYNSEESKELYVKQVKAILNSGKDRYGFIGWSSMNQVSNAVNNLLITAQRQVQNKNYKSAIFICTALMEQMMEAAQYSDDSRGGIGDSIENGLQILYDISAGQTDEKTRKLLIDYCFTSFEEKVFKGWDWHLSILQLASDLLKTDEEVNRIFKLIDNVKGSKYDHETSQVIKYEIILKTQGEAAAEQYLDLNITNSDLRKVAIDLAVNKGDFERAKMLANDGITNDKDEWPGLVNLWYDWLLTIAQKEDDQEKVIEYARYLLIDNLNQGQDYYRILKQYVNPEQWNFFVEDLVRDISKSKHWAGLSMTAIIFIEEKWWDRLLTLVKQSKDLKTIEHYEKYLKEDYSDELITFYADAVIESMKYSQGRSSYRTACKYIRRLIKLGGREKANEIIGFLRNEYPQRRALMDELNKV